MTKWSAPLAMAVLLVGATLGDYVADRKTYVALVKAGKHEEALAAFLALAGRATSDVQKSDALHQAVWCATELGRHDQALELARQIPQRALATRCQMHVLESQRHYAEIVRRFKDEDIASWPESLRGDAYLCRGHAHFALKDGSAAVKDFHLAVNYLTDGNAVALSWIYLGDAYRTLLKDDTRALAAYRKTHGVGNVYKQCQAALNVVAILKHQGKQEAALAELDRIKMAEVTVPDWRGKMLGAMGDALAAIGRKKEAAGKYQEALQIKDLSPAVRSQCDRALKELGTK